MNRKTRRKKKRIRLLSIGFIILVGIFATTFLVNGRGKKILR